ncbi:hypothetical protein CO157_01045 [Candidatus Peregrinibacteria bacterium CG_4_9_14_3_um_filter_49_12]|nr:MAG: hypothetical protein CO157_01045 [Candidatus Peregrinibacteria bacterium CG_4_9_14_3_um_filter_49_12]
MLSSIVRKNHLLRMYFFVLLFVLSSAALAFDPTNNGGPSDGQTGVPVEAFIDREFDLPLSGATLTVGASGTVRLQTNDGNVQGGTPTGDNLCITALLKGGNRIECDHMADGQPLLGNTWYTFTLTTGIKTATGMALSANAAYQFQTNSFTGGADFIPPPFVIGGVPRAGTTFPSNAKMRVYFSVGGSGASTVMRTDNTGSVLSPQNIKLFAAENGRPANDTNLLACASVGANPALPTDCNMAWNSTGSELIITPGKKSPGGSIASTGGAGIAAGQQYVLMIQGAFDGAGGVQNSDGIGMPFTHFVSFTATGSDTLGPTLKGTYPANNATGVDRAIYNINIGFSESVDDGSVDSTSILLYEDFDDNGAFDAGVDVVVTSAVDYFPELDAAVISPTALLEASTKYFVVITTNVLDLAGNNFDGDRATGGNQQKVIAFTTGNIINGGVSDTTKPKISFANANNFSVEVSFTEPLQFDNESRNGASSDISSVVNNINNWTLQSPIGSTVSLSNKRIEYEPSTLTATIFDLLLPPDQTFLVKTATSTGAIRMKDLAGNLMETTGSGNLAKGTVSNVHDGVSGEFNFGNGIRVLPRTPMASAISAYEVEFAAATSIPLGGTIVFTMPSGFAIVDDGGASECEDIANVPDNSDINGPATGAITIASIVCDATARTVTITTGGAATTAGDRLRFLLQGISNSSIPKDFTTSGYSVDIKTKGLDGSVLNTLTSQPFFLMTPGTQTIAGTVYNDNGDGGGTANDGTKNGSEPGIANIKVCLGGSNGFSCQTTDVNGAYSFTLLNNGFYNLNIPPLATGSYIGGPFFRDVQLSGGQNSTGVNFAFRSSDRNISITVGGIPSNTDLDVFAFNSTSTNGGGHIVREVLWNGNASRSVTLPVSDGTWEIGVGPWIPKDPSLGPPSMPDFTFMPPKPQQMKINGVGTYETSLTLASANRTIKGKVVDGGGTGIADAFVLARPTGTGALNGGMAQTDANGNFNVKVQNGVYYVDAGIPGMPPTAPIEVTVRDNSGASDSNSTADVYSKGVLLVNDGDNGSDNLLLKVAKGNLYISGRVLDEDGNAISYAHVMAQEVDSSDNPNGPFMGTPTDTSGNYTIYVRSGRYKVFAHAPQYGELPALTVVVAAGSNATGQNIQAVAGDFGTVTGTITKGGTAVAGAFVNIFGASGGNGTVTDASGGYSLKVQAGSNYTIEGFVPGSGPLTPLSSITITAGQTLSSQDLSMAEAGTIKVTLTGSSIINNAFVEARDSNGRGNSTSVNTTPGVYEIPVPAGTYTVKAQSPGMGLIGSESVTVTANNVASVTMAPSAIYVVSGTISSDSTSCTIGASIIFGDSTNGRVTKATSASGGTFSISLPNGTYRLSAGKPGCIDSAAPTTITVNGANVSSGTNRTLTAADGTISGRVTLSSTGITVGTVVIAENADGTFAFADVDTTQTGGGNNYTLNLTAGTWTIKARSEGYESASTSVTLSTGGSATANLSLTAISGYTRKDPKTSTMTPSRGGLVYDTNIGSSFKMNVPAGALGNASDATSISTKQTTAVADETPTAVVPGGKGYEISATAADGQKVSDLSASVTITIPYTEADVTAAGGTEAALVGAVWENGQWTPLSTTVDTENNTITMVTSHFSTFAPVVPTGGGSSGGGGGSSGGGSSGGGGGGGRRSLPSAGAINGIHAAASLHTNAPPREVVDTTHLRSVRGYLVMSIEDNDVTFRDVSVQEWFAPFVATIMRAGIASGYRNEQGNPKGEFGPGNRVTYGEIAKMALEAARFGPGSLPAKNPSAQGDWSSLYIGRAEEFGLSVYLDSPDVRDSARRGEVIQTLVEVLEITEPAPKKMTEIDSGTLTGTGETLSGSGRLIGSGSVLTATGDALKQEEEVPMLPDVSFTDIRSNHPHAQAILLLAKLGVISGDTDRDGKPTGNVRPNDPINRAEVAKIFTKLIELGYIR